MNTIAVLDSGVSDRGQDGYETFLSEIRNHFAGQSGQGPLFTTNVGDLWSLFLDGLPQFARKHYTCHACRRFVEQYGGLVRITPDGRKVSVIWPDPEYVPAFFTASVVAIRKAIAKARVNGVFVSSQSVYGQPVTGEWHHMAVRPSDTNVWRSRTQSAHQRAAEKAEEFKMLVAGLNEYPRDVVEQALKLLESDALYRSEKVIGPAWWLRSLHIMLSTLKDAAAKENITWVAVAGAPAGFCHVRSTMIGTLLEDIAAHMDFETVSKRFAAKMHPLQYQRPQAAPTAGNIAQAEKVIQQLQAAGSLDRRFARLEELTTLWRPAQREVREPASVGVFGHLTPKAGKQNVADIEVPVVTITWEKFHRTVLPNAYEMELYAVGSQNFSAITTAVHADAPPILQWDTEGRRNPFAWYVYNRGSFPHEWNLTPGWVKVTGVCLSPSMWQEGIINQAKSVHFILDGARDKRYEKSGNALFPETLKSEFHGIRATIEAYSRRAVLFGYDEASACGVRAGDSWGISVRVTNEFGVSSYRLDRWD